MPTTAELTARLLEPGAYPHVPASVELRQTHISLVFLAGDSVFKIKKPVKLPFADFSTLALRRRFCEEEVRLNHRLAPSVYLGTAPVLQSSGSLMMGEVGAAAADAVEWAVVMRRLPDAASLRARLREGPVEPVAFERLAARLAAFHAGARRGPEISAAATFDAVAGNARDNFDQSSGHVGSTVSANLLGRVRDANERALSQLRPLIEARAAVACDTHGDLHLDHVYLFDDRPAPDDLAIVDCIEFNERFRFADPVADIAFLAMDLRFHGHADHARTFANAWFAAAGAESGRPLLPFYCAYRAAVRAKVDGIRAAQSDAPPDEREAARRRGQAHWLSALWHLEPPGKRPCLLLVSGLPGTGKSTLSRGLADRAGFEVIRADVVRKRLAGLPETQSAASAPGEGIYTPAWHRRVYEECARLAEASLREGARVIVDANFREDAVRGRFVEMASRLALPLALMICRAEVETVRARLAGRTGDASDADFAVYQSAAAAWQEPGEHWAGRVFDISADGDAHSTLARAIQVLRDLELVDRQ